MLKTKVVKRYLAAAAAIGLASTAQAVVIDNFSTSQAILTVDNDTNTAATGTAQSTASGAGILGGFRDISLNLISATGKDASSIEVLGASNSVRFNQDTSSKATATITYDGNAVAGLDFTTPLNSDLTAGGSLNFLAVTVGSADVGATLDFTAFTTSAGNTKKFTLAIATPIIFGSPQTFFIPFASFATTGAATFSDVDAFQIAIGGATAVDISVNAVSSEVPEPTTALAGLGIFTVVGTTLRRRARQSAVVA